MVSVILLAAGLQACLVKPLRAAARIDRIVAPRQGEH
jgi:hypothetical protein